MILLYGLVGLVTCFIGTVPFGPINLMVVKTTVDHDVRRGMQVALAASIIEILEVFIAISFGMMIIEYLDSNYIVRILIATLCIIFAYFIVTRGNRQTLNDNNQNGDSFFLQGMILALLNPQAIPFWIFALAVINQYIEFDYSGVYLALFLGGVFAGKLAALTAFVYSSHYLKSHLQQTGKQVNRILAAVLMLIAISQLWEVVSKS